MTLVVARRVSNSMFIIGDTKLTLEKTKGKLSATQGVIKSKIVSPGLAVSFANNEYIAEAAVQSIAGSTDADTVVRTLFEAHVSVEEKYAPDFIVATTGPVSDLLTIRDGRIEHVANAWIGSAEAFRLFRAYETENRQPTQLIANSAAMTGVQIAGAFGEVAEGVETYTRMLECVKHVIDDEFAADVGGFAIPLIGNNGAFAYFGYADVKTHPLTIKEGDNVVEFGTAAQGGYAYDLVATGDNRGLSSYFLQGRFGIVYLDNGGGLLRPNLIQDVSPIEFEEIASQVAGSNVATWYADNRILCQRALDRLASGDIDGALADANRAIERGGQHSDAWKCRGMVLSKLNREDQALLDFTRAVEVTPRDADAWNKLGISHRILGMTESAIRSFSEAIQREPTFWRALANRATGYWEAGQPDMALRDISEALIHQPNNARLWRNKAAAHLGLGMRGDALISVQKALELWPDNVELVKAEQDLRDAHATTDLRVK